MNTHQPCFKTLFLCTGNSARSIFAEFIAKKNAGHILEAYSAGSAPKAAPHPLAIQTLKESFGIDPTEARSKSWEEFKNVEFDFVITVCDKARESCPVWPGRPVIAHWGSPDPVEFQGTDEEKLNAFWQVAHQIKRRIELFTYLPFQSLDQIRLEAATKEIGKQELLPPSL
jgi:arsenate reductase